MMQAPKNKPAFSLSSKGLAFVKKELNRYETKRSAILPCLYWAQKENKGWISEEVVSHLSQVMAIPTAQIKEVLSFYTLFNKQPVGKWHIQVCCNLSCAMNGAREVVQKLCEGFKVKVGERSQDGFVTISRVECLGACDQAPVAQVKDRFIGPLKSETVIQDMRNLMTKSVRKKETSDHS